MPFGHSFFLQARLVVSDIKILNYSIFHCVITLLRTYEKTPLTNRRTVPRKHKKTSAFAEVSFGFLLLLRRGRDSNSWYPNQVRRFSKPVVSATHPPLRFAFLSERVCKYRAFFGINKISKQNFHTRLFYRQLNGHRCANCKGNHHQRWDQLMLLPAAD